MFPAGHEIETTGFNYYPSHVEFQLGCASLPLDLQSTIIRRTSANLQEPSRLPYKNPLSRAVRLPYKNPLSRAVRLPYKNPLSRAVRLPTYNGPPSTRLQQPSEQTRGMYLQNLPVTISGAGRKGRGAGDSIS